MLRAVYITRCKTCGLDGRTEVRADAANTAIPERDARKFLETHALMRPECKEPAVEFIDQPLQQQL
jgi:hypothetical protein